ncbi:hypothetical protein RSOL_230450 [Rhizoctonia solani AG-3 Rhs1AP]|uniref:Uncharacterized protein n=2 Tax=Rhizoctonia solani AG-3 TaxID=1086053 RepID=A0A074S070_9AGAM|nr:hypothetical protein RSOL_230450 [Rhizoctonia solani AG-3 Rhs1AP]KEP50268.1 hypothetical protein V565_083160 [Rhizoctonia solani 123E]
MSWAGSDCSGNPGMCDAPSHSLLFSMAIGRFPASSAFFGAAGFGHNNTALCNTAILPVLPRPRSCLNSDLGAKRGVRPNLVCNLQCSPNLLRASMSLRAPVDLS